ncbi:MAG TPA: DUF3995 domain-containing protein [Solirubrobacterales bacterium]|jgi:hypothetical protein|nr:DUF3995 domain-containing protein [Solirubrobacterales bacterium]
MGTTAVATRIASASLLAIAGLHLNWARGSSWPLPDHEALADEVAGRPDADPPSAAACLAVAGLLGAAAAFVAGHPRGSPGLSRLGAAGVVVTLAGRGGFGMAGRTDLLSRGSVSERFRARDRRVYSPLCLALAALSLPAALGSPGGA